MTNSIDVPEGAVSGLAEILTALGDELRRANHKVGETIYRGDDGEEDEVEPVLFLDHASVELAITVTTTGTGGLKFWVVNAEAGGSQQQSGKITVALNTNGQEFSVGGR